MPLDLPRSGVIVQAFAGPAQATRWFVAEPLVLPALLAEAVAAGLDRHTRLLGWGFSEFGQRRGPWTEILDVQEVALGAAERLGDGLAAARCHNSLARAHLRLGHDGDAVTHFERALRMHADFDEPVLEAHVHLGLTVPLSRIRPGRELGHAVRAMELFRQAGDAIGKPRALNNTSWWRAKRGRTSATSVPPTCCRAATTCTRPPRRWSGSARRRRRRAMWRRRTRRGNGRSSATRPSATRTPRRSGSGRRH
ncbi:tetratricopeptide repeat protein [Nonomuraea sp. NPDC001699]